MNKKDRIFLRKILEYHKVLTGAIKDFKIADKSDLDNIHYMVRRGMIQTVGDIFELSSSLPFEILSKLPLNSETIKQFRNTATHSYGRINNVFAYACIIHCSDRKLSSVITELLADDEASPNELETKIDEN